jgi:hypothetical protein
MMTEPPLEDLICEAREGRTESFAHIVRLFERPIRGWLLRHSPPGVDADDVAQAFVLDEDAHDPQVFAPGTTPPKGSVNSFRATLRSSADYWSGSLSIGLSPALRPQIEVGRRRGNGDRPGFVSSDRIPTGRPQLWIVRIESHADRPDEVAVRVVDPAEADRQTPEGPWNTVAQREGSAVLDTLVITGTGTIRRRLSELRIGTSLAAVLPR